MSDGRLKIQVFGAGELIPALEGFDAVRVGHRRDEPRQQLLLDRQDASPRSTSPPCRSASTSRASTAGSTTAAASELWNEVYAPFGMVAMPCGNTGVQMTGWFKKEIKSVADLKGLKMRIPGLAGKVYAQLGVDVKLLPGGEIFPALERGVIDAAEFVGPYPGPPARPAQGRQVLLHHRLARDGHRVRTADQQGRLGQAAARTCRRSSRTPRPPAT